MSTTRTRSLTITLTPLDPNSRSAWYGHGMNPDVEDQGAGAEFRLTVEDRPRVLEDLTVVWRYTSPGCGERDGHIARIELPWSSTGRNTYADLGSPRTAAGLARKIAAVFNDERWLQVLRTDRVRVVTPADLPFPNEY